MNCAFVELLESRIAPAGLITVDVTKSGLLVLGTTSDQDGDELLTITQQDDDTFLLTPGLDTTLRIGGQDFTTPQVIPKVLLGLVANLGKGNDQLTLTDVTFAKSVKVSLGDGNNQLTMENSVMASLVVTGLGGNDTITGTGQSFGAGSVKVKLGDGNNFLVLDAVSVAIAAGIQYQSGSGNDSFRLGDVDGRIAVQGGIQCKLGDGNNFANFGGANALVKASGSLQISAGSGNDSILFEGALAQFASVNATLGDGTNFFTSHAAAFQLATDFRFSGGSGVDTVDIGGAKLFVGRNLTAKLGEGRGSFEMRQDGTNDATLTVQGTSTVSLAGDPVNPSEIRFEAFAGVTLGGPVRLTAGDGNNTLIIFSLGGDVILGKGAFLKTGEGDGTTSVSNNSAILCNGPLSLIREGNEGVIIHNSGINRGSFVKGPLTMLGSSLISSSFAGINMGPVRIATGPDGIGDIDFRSNGTDGRYLAKGLDILAPAEEGQTRLINISLVRSDQSIRIRGGDGDDTVSLNGVSFQGALTVDLLGGNDQFNLEQEASGSGTLYSGAVLLKGGAGADQFLIGGNNVGQEIVFQNKVILDGGDGTDSVTIGASVTPPADFPIEQKNIP